MDNRKHQVIKLSNPHGISLSETNWPWNLSSEAFMCFPTIANQVLLCYGSRHQVGVCSLVP